MALPVTLMVPAPVSRLTSTVAAAVELQPRPAVVARLALWQRRPAGVLCVEEADLQLAPVAVYVEQQHALQLAEYLALLSASFEAAAAAAAAASTGARAGGGAQPGPAALLSGGSAGDFDGGGGGGSSRTASEASMAAGGAGLADHGAPVPAVHAGLGAATAVTAAAAAPRLLGLQPEVEALLSGQGGASLAPAEQKVYIDVLRIGTLELNITFMPAPFQPDPGAQGRAGHVREGS